MNNSRRYPTEEEKTTILELYKCHFTAKEIAKQIPFGYQTIQNYFRGFKLMKIQKYNRLDLIPKGECNDAQCNTR